MAFKSKKQKLELLHLPNQPVSEEARTELIQAVTSVDKYYQKYLDKLSEQKAERLKTNLRQYKYGLQASAPLTCHGPHKCPFIEHCPIPPRDEESGAPIFENGEQDFGPLEDYPVHRSCVLESFLMRQKMVDYIQHLNVDPDNPIELSIVNELALIDLYKNRALLILSVGDKQGYGRDLMRTDVTGFADSGARIEKTDIHPVAKYIDLLEKRREKWLDKLIETREGKIKMAAKLGQVQADSHILGELKLVREALKDMTGKALTYDDDPVEISFDEVEVNSKDDN